MACRRAKRATRALIGAAAVLCGLLVFSLNPTRAAAQGDCVVPHSLGVVFILDDSGSMAYNDPEGLRGAAAGSAIDALPDGSVVAASKFTEEAVRISAPTVLDGASRPGLKAAVAAGLESFGGTDYDVAFTEAKNQLDAMTGVDKKAVVFLSDGEPNYPYTADQAIAAEGVPIFAVGFGEVPPAELSAIAARSGGQAFALSSAAQAQEIFARVVSALTCDVQLTTATVNLKPGEQRKFPFHVQRGQRGFHGQVTWSSGELEVSLIRPDGSRLTQTAPGPNEHFDATPNSASVSVTRPPPGKWQVLVRAPRQSVDNIKVHIDAWQREPPGSTSTEDPEGPPPPKGGEGCRYKASFGSLQLEASCFKIEHGVLIASGRVRIDGLDISPDSDVTIKLDPKTLQLSTTGEVTVSAGEVILYKGKLEKTLQGHLPFQVPKALSKLKGFPIKGSADVSFDAGVAKIKLIASIPQLGGVTGQVEVTASNSAGLQLGQASIDLPEAKIKAIPIKEVHLGYERTDEGDKWSGSAKVELPSPTVKSVSGGATFLNGSFAEAHAAVDGNFPIAEAVFLTHLDASLKLKPNFAFGGGMGLSGGPKVGDIRAVGLDGHFDYTSGEPDEYKLSGNLKIVNKLELGNGYISYKTNGQFEMGGHLNFTIGGVGFEGDLGGFASGNGFELTGDGTVGYHGHGLGAKGIVSSVGLAACGKLDFWVGSITAGFGVRWAHFDHPSVFAGSCDLGPWKVEREGAHASALEPTQTQTFRVRRRMPVLAFSAVGVGGPPRITVKGPDGTKATTPSPDAGLVGTPDTAAFADPEDGTTYILIRKPARGRWTVRVNSGPAVKVIRSAAGLPRPHVHAEVRGRGHDRRLVFSARKIHGQRLVFSERGPGVGARIGSSKAGRGVLRFHPADGPRGKRHIFVSVLQRGLVRRRFAVATYKAPRPLHPRRARGVRIVRHGMKAVVIWTPAQGAHSYDVRVKVSDGRRLMFSRKAHDRRVVVKGVLKQWRVRAAVVGVSAAGRPGAPSKATSRPQRHRRHHHRRHRR